MSRYILSHGQTRLPIDGIRVTPREGLPPLRQAETVLFTPFRVVESDLDFGTWVADGVLVRLPEPGDPPARVPEVARAVRPTAVMPIPAVVEMLREVAPQERAPQVVESHLTTGAVERKPLVVDQAPAEEDLRDAGVPMAADPVVEKPTEEVENVPAVQVAAEKPARDDATAAVRRPYRGMRPKKG